MVIDGGLDKEALAYLYGRTEYQCALGTNCKISLSLRYNFSSTVDAAILVLSLSDSQSTTDLLIKARPHKRHLLLAMPVGGDLQEQRTTINPSRTKCGVDGTPRQRLQQGHDMEDANVDHP
jgi:hypothetical protein